MKKIFTLIFAAVLAVSCWGTVVVIGESSSSTDSNFPIVMTTGISSSITQQIYLKSDFTSQGVTSGNITSISFYYSSQTPTEYSRNLEIWIMEKSTSSYTSTYFDATSSTVKSPGIKCFDGEATIPAKNGWYDIPLTNAFNWKGTNNLIVTVYDKSTSPTGNFKKHKVVSATNRGKYTSSISKTISQIWDQTGTTTSIIPAIKFNFGSPTPTYDKPSNVSVTAKSSTTATIGWTKKDSANIKLEYKLKSAQSWTTAVSGLNANSYTITGLSSETEYDYQVFAVYPTGTSDAVSGTFTTDAPSSHEHDGVSFQEWTATDALPTTAGSYFLKDNVTVSSWTVPTGDTKICLNGKTITFNTVNKYLTINSGSSVSIYDNEGNGAITTAQSFNPTIKVNGGTLSLYGGSINNTASSEVAYAISVESGTFNVKGNVKMSTTVSSANIYLKNSGNVITLVGAITNSDKLSVKKTANLDITFGWSTQMGSADPANYFSSKNSDAPAVVLVDGEAQLGVPEVTISETGTNTFTEGLKNVNLIRTFQANILNTISLPFALTNAQLEEKFGTDYELYELGSSSLSDGVLSLTFNKVTTLDDGYPYLLRVSSAVENPSFSSVTLTKENHTKQTSAVDMVAVISEKNITNYENVLFLNAAGELNWSTAAGDFKGMRAYFKLNSGSPSNISARRIVLGTDATTGLMQNVECTMQNDKVMINGQLFIIKNGVTYNAQGQIVK